MLEPAGFSEGVVLLEDDVFVLVAEVVVVVEDVLEEDVAVDLLEELVEDVESEDELVLEELPELSDFEEPAELLTVPLEELPE